MACRKIHQKRPGAEHVEHRSLESLPSMEEPEARVRVPDVSVDTIFFCYADAMQPWELSAKAGLDRGFAMTK
jgi:hypothetical protein